MESEELWRLRARRNEKQKEWDRFRGAAIAVIAMISLIALIAVWIFIGIHFAISNGNFWPIGIFCVVAVGFHPIKLRWELYRLNKELRLAEVTERLEK